MKTSIWAEIAKRRVHVCVHSAPGKESPVQLQEHRLRHRSHHDNDLEGFSNLETAISGLFLEQRMIQSEKQEAVKYKTGHSLSTRSSFIPTLGRVCARFHIGSFNHNYKSENILSTYII